MAGGRRAPRSGLACPGERKPRYCRADEVLLILIDKVLKEAEALGFGAKASASSRRTRLRHHGIPWLRRNGDGA
jgi:hypothetical protein